MNEQLKQELLGDVADLLTKHRRLLELANRQRRALIDREHDTLQRLLPEFEQVAAEIVEVEQHRVQVTTVIASELGLNPDEATSVAFVSAFGGKAGGQLDALSRELKEVVQQLARANDHNARLTKFSIDYTQKILDLITGAVNNETYGPGKRVNQGARILSLEA